MPYLYPLRMHNEIFNLVDLLGNNKIEMRQAFNLYCSFSRLREDDIRFYNWMEKHHHENLEKIPLEELTESKNRLFGKDEVGEMSVEELSRKIRYDL
jgi:hypothetical protein